MDAVGGTITVWGQKPLRLKFLVPGYINCYGQVIQRFKKKKIYGSGVFLVHPIWCNVMSPHYYPLP